MMNAVDPAEYYQGNTVEMNRQEAGGDHALKERNTELMEQVKQVQFYAAVLDAFTSHPDNTSECVSHQGSAFTTHTHSYASSAEPSDRHFNAALQTSWLESLLNHTPPEEDECSLGILSEHTNAGVKRKLWPSDIESSSANNPADKKSRLDQEFLDQSEHQLSEQLDSETVQVFGSFRNFQVLKASPCATSDLWREGKRVFFKTSIREHSTVRTRRFPHGKTFTSHTPDGGCRFLWIPNQI
ncbi:hypothetical protein Q7C36_020295 [Tachysurus vachellii]|uniref:Uncharacterized protein n=1 Tax=Tachysurus vachellii TaxID=175792 RepID=A0AA88RXF4_TACVA|nr:hypothetical protein Q7C36_020295 [Tachysurus vachellii]